MANKNKNDNSETSKMNINWYPGHMAKTRKQIAEDLKLVDIVIEILDARIPRASQNPDIAGVIKNKKKMVILNKCDLADEKQNQRWIEYFKNKNIPAVLTDANSGKGIDKCIKTLENFMQDEMKVQSQKGRVGRKIRAMVIGIPNVGKSSFINRISKKTSAGVGNKPGVTKQKQWIRVNEEVALHLSFIGTIREDILDRTEVAYYLTKFLIENYKDKLLERYKLKEERVDELLNQEQDENTNIYDVFMEIGRKRGCIISGGNIDEEKTARILLDEYKNGIVGRITIEWANG